MRRKQMGRSGRKRKHKPQSWLYPWATEKRYAAAIRAWLRPMMDYVHTYLKNNEEAILRGDSASLVRQDATPGGSYRRLVKSLNGWLMTYLPDINESGSRDAPPLVFMGLGNIAESLNDFNSAQWQKSARAELGIEFPMYEEWWEPTKQAWQEENYKYFQDLGRNYINQINRKAEQAVLSGWSVAQLAGEIAKIDKSIKQGRANLIARDQIGKLNEQVTQSRMEQAGLTMYIWSTAQDERVRGNPDGHFPNARPSHYLMEGLLCRWSDSTVYSDDGGKTWKPRPSNAVMLHPGQDIQCRCTALSYWDELVGEADSVIDREEGYNTPNIPSVTIPGSNTKVPKKNKKTGGEYGALRDKSQPERDKFATEYYGAIRHRKSKSDIEAIAKNTGISEEDISAIRQHIFSKEHDMGEGKIERFSPDWKIAQAWQRLEKGNYTKLDILLLNHELYELQLIKEKGYNYPKAHAEAQKMFPWYIEWKKAYGEEK
jgi:hypothetical protein